MRVEDRGQMSEDRGAPSGVGVIRCGTATGG